MLYDPVKFKEPKVEPLEPWREGMLRAADFIERWGWWDGTLNGGNRYGHNVCAIQALARSFNTEDDRLPAGYFNDYGKACEAFSQFIGDRRIPSWNDRQTSGAVVVKALRDCAKQGL
jgi:hypothetical protein